MEKKKIKNNKVVEKIGIKGSRKNIFKVREFGVLIGLVMLVLVFSLTSKYFFTLENILNTIRQVSILGILAIGMTFVITSGEFDLSVGSTFGMSAMLCAVCMINGIPIWICAIISLISGVIIGVVNGVLVSYFRIPSFIVTLGMLNVVRGITQVATNGMPISLNTRLVKDPALTTFQFIGSGKIADTIPMLSISFIVIVIIGYIIFNRTIIGFHMRAVGDNPVASMTAGLNVNYIKIIAFAILGFLAAFGGLLNLAFASNFLTTMGSGIELDVIAAVILGGTSISGGAGTIIGTIIGVLIIGVLRNGLVLLGISPFIQTIIIGLVIIGSVGIDMYIRKKY